MVTMEFRITMETTGRRVLTWKKQEIEDKLAKYIWGYYNAKYRKRKAKKRADEAIDAMLEAMDKAIDEFKAETRRLP